MSEPQDALDILNNDMHPDEIEATSQDWYDRWRGRIHDWVSHYTDNTIGDLLLVVPDLFMLLVDLSKDKRVPFVLKAQILAVLAYVISPVDLLPEAMLGVVGLADDLGVMAALLLSMQHLGKIDSAILQEHWRGTGNIQEVTQQVYDSIEQHGDKFLDSDTWSKIKNRFGSDEPQSEGKFWRFWRRGRVHTSELNPLDEE